MKLLSLALPFGLTCSAFSGVPIASNYVIQGWGTECFLLMRPAVINDKFSEIGTCYRIKEDGGFEKLWQIEGGYSFRSDVFLGGDGSILIKVVEVFLPKAGTPNEGLSKQSALEFYRDGKLIKKFNAEEIVDSSKLETVGFPGTLPSYPIFNYDDATAPKMGRLPHFDFFDDDDKKDKKKRNR